MGALHNVDFWNYAPPKKDRASALRESEALRISRGVWIFGSCTWSSSPSDVDILLVYQVKEDADYAIATAFRTHVAAAILADLQLQSDVVLLSRSEEDEIGFALSEAAVQVWP